MTAKNRIRVFSGRLRMIERNIGVPGKLYRIAAALRYRDTHTGTDHDVGPIDVEWPLKAFDDIVRDLTYLIDSVLIEQECELITADAGHYRTREKFGHPRCSHRNYFVTDGMAEGVVDLLEPIQINEKYTMLVLHIRFCNAGGELFVEEGSVGQPCQAVVICLMAKGILARSKPAGPTPNRATR
jgi:hypothetical protein